MVSNVLPGFFARGAISLLPPIVLERLLEALMRKMERRRPRLFANLRRLPEAAVRIEPSDMERAFFLTLGPSGVLLRLAREDDRTGTKIKGRLAVLLSMLEGQEDGDTMFFSRDLTIEGDTSVIVGLRNTLDREEIDVLEEVLSLFGPLASPAGKAASFLGKAASVLQDGAEKWHNDLHNRHAGARDRV